MTTIADFCYFEKYNIYSRDEIPQEYTNDLSITAVSTFGTDNKLGPRGKQNLPNLSPNSSQ